MIHAVRHFPPPKDPSSRGMALVTTLSALILVAVLILAFFSRARINMQVAFSSTNQVKADLACRSALDLIVGELREEIRSGSTVLAGAEVSSPLYQPLAPLDFLPQKEGVSSPNAIGTATLLKVSAPNTPINPGTGGRTLGSSLSTSVSSANGRYLSTASWFGTQGPQLGSQPALPTWVFWSRGGSVVTAPSYSLPASDPRYVTGRFAYVVYDTGGLLNANVAGYPSAAASDAGYKSCAAYADLSQIPGIVGDSLLAWRNGADASSAAAYGSYVQNWGLRYGFLSTKAGDNAFVSRHDLIQCAEQGVAGLSVPALGYLTHFSRAVEAPSWKPVNPPGINSSYDYAGNAEAAASSNRNVPNVRFTGITAPGSVTHYADDGTSTTYPVNPGDPLLQRRFSLAKIAWLQEKEEGAANAPSNAAIQACFGLQWDSANDRWNYVGPSGATVQSSIKTLAQIAAEAAPREPNFFELLKAGILSGSVGTSSQTQTVAMTPGQNLDLSQDLHLLKIGADIIDCAETDNYPTVLALNFSGVTTEIAGITDLPYLYGVNLGGFYSSTATKFTGLDFVLVPIFINPHRPSDSAATSGPASVALDIPYGTLTYTAITLSPSPVMKVISNKNLGGAAFLPVTISSSQFETFRQNPQPQTTAGAANSIGTLIPYNTSPYGSALGFLFYSYENEAPEVLADSSQYPAPGSNNSFSIYFSNLMFRLRYQARSGRMKTYYTMGGNEAFGLTTGLGGPGRSLAYGPSISLGKSNTDFTASYFLACLDPRSNRLGPSLGWSRPLLGPALPSTANDSLKRYQAYGAPVTDSAAAPLAMFPQGAKTLMGAGSYSNTVDNDQSIGGTLRPADGWLGAVANPYVQASGSNMDPSSQSRPVILHRPYRSVAELGYVFRDSPWKTLSFFDETSADSGLLDLFNIADMPALADGAVHLGTRQASVLAALLNGTGQNSDGSNPLSAPAAIASAYDSYAFASGQPTASLPMNVAQLANFMSSTSLATAGLDSIKYHREAVVRALRGSVQTRTWNILVDVVAQVGHYGPNAKSLNDFIVEGERRYWASVAIDRFTDKVIDTQLEPADD